MTFLSVAKSTDIEPGKGKCFDVDSKKIAVFNVDGKFYALDDMCPHKGAPLSTGMVGVTEVTCPWHGASFELASGKGLGGPCSGGINSYPVRVNGNEIELDV